MSLHKNIAGIVTAIISILLLNNVAKAQTSARGSATVAVVRPITITVENHVTALTKAEVTEFLKADQKQTGKQAHQTSFLLPLTKEEITFATLQIRDAGDSDLNVTFPISILLKKTGNSETMTAYDFKYKEQLSKKDHLRTVQLMATVAMSIDQETGFYQSALADVVVNYN